MRRPDFRTDPPPTQYNPHLDRYVMSAQCWGIQSALSPFGLTCTAEHGVGRVGNQRKRVVSGTESSPDAIDADGLLKDIPVAIDIEDDEPSRTLG
ncbi:hypothetical protein B0H10DRAFT_2227990 [Mycena sp. CBHHK59/15]|nr:hypothetical protein B0H10DRAFT_2227990 [Mycena sp. CBHHK59/15]